jgi:hypothetical protein
MRLARYFQAITAFFIVTCFQPSSDKEPRPWINKDSTFVYPTPDTKDANEKWEATPSLFLIPTELYFYCTINTLENCDPQSLSVVNNTLHPVDIMLANIEDDPNSFMGGESRDNFIVLDFHSVILQPQESFPVTVGFSYSVVMKYGRLVIYTDDISQPMLIAELKGKVLTNVTRSD